METGPSPTALEAYPVVEEQLGFMARMREAVHDRYESVSLYARKAVAIGASTLALAGVEIGMNAEPVAAEPAIERPAPQHYGLGEAKPVTPVRYYKPAHIENILYTPQAVDPETPGSQSVSPEAVKRDCIKVALQKPRIIDARVLHAGQFEPEPEQRFSLTTQYKEKMPDECNGLYSQGNKAKAEVWHDGKWKNATYWHGVGILDYSDRGTWYDLGNERSIDFPVCKARILIRATAVDLQRDTGDRWAPHPIIAKKPFAPVPMTLIPYKPLPC